MAIEALEPREASARARRSLDLDPDDLEVDSPVVHAAAVRRAASFMCPTRPAALVRTVSSALSPLTGTPDDELRALIQAAVGSVIASGDLLELPIDGAGARRALMLGPPAFVRVGAGYLLVGVRPEGVPIVSDDLGAEIEYRGHSRLIPSLDPTLRERLVSDGLIELSAEHWLAAPRRCSARELANGYVERLAAARGTSDIDGIEILDPRSDVRFYRGRWRALDARDTGCFVARRPQAFGARLWCCAQIASGEVASILDLPTQSLLSRGCDEAWRLQAALDALAGRPQRLRLKLASDTPGSVVLDMFSPIPNWAQRRLDSIATPLPHSRGALASYLIRQNDVDAEVGFLESMMWVVREQGASTNE